MAWADETNRRAKIVDVGTIRHGMSDLGDLDERGRLCAVRSRLG
jgi:hypothetical protein